MLRFQLSNKRERHEFEHVSGPIEFGRGGQRNGVPRCVIQDLYVSKDHVHVLELEGGKVKIENLSTRNSIRLADNSIIAVGTSRELPTPVHLTVGETYLNIESSPDDPDGPLQTIATPIRRKTDQDTHSLLEVGRAPTPETLARYFETVVTVQKAAAGSPEFYEQTAKAVVDLVGLDKGLVVLRRQNMWAVQARYPDQDSFAREFSATILERVKRERRTFFQSSASAPSTTESLQGVEAVVASPIFDPREEVVGAVYGCRTRFTQHAGLGIGPLEAAVMQVLASTVGVGLARLEQEAEASRLRVQFEQFFSADLARELRANPRLLEGQEREVTILFSDIRTFSRHARKLGPFDTCKLVQDVMECLTARVREFEGVVVDYAGDGIMCMWNAPTSQVDHAVKACRAALAMLADLPKLDAEWHQRLGCPLRLGIGLNTGQALVGNTGSRLKFKYGALGHCVNLASRVEGATKQLGIALLITGSTKAQLPETFATRRLCKARLAGIEEAVDLYELHAEGTSPEWQGLRETYEKALGLYETARFDDTCRTLYPLLLGGKDQDVPSLNLVGRAIEGIKAPPRPEDFDGVISFTTK